MILFAKARKTAKRRVKRKPMSKGARRKASALLYKKNRAKILKKQHRRYHSDAKYRNKKLRAARKYRMKRAGGPPFFRSGKGKGKRPLNKRMPRVHKPNKFVGGKRKKSRRK